jgi:C-terminal processing protease CtpA/Prc
MLGLGAIAIFAGSAWADDPVQDLQDAQSEAAEEFQSEVDEQADEINQEVDQQQEAIDQEVDQQQEAIDQEVDEQQNQIDQEIDQATDQAAEQQDTVNDQLDETQEQATEQERELEQQTDQSQNQLDRLAGEAEELLQQARDQFVDDPSAEGRLRLGVSVDPSATGSGGLTIGEIMQGSAAAEAGLRRGDVILSIDGEEITTSEQLDTFLRGQRVGDSADFIVLRDGQRQPMTITFQEAHFHAMPRESHYGPDFRQGSRQMGRHGYLGVTLEPDGDPFATPPGVGIVSVVEPGPAANAGIEPGDRILAFENEEISSMGQLLERLARTNPGDEVDFVVLQDGDERSLTAVLDDASVFQSQGQAGYSYQPGYGASDVIQGSGQYGSSSHEAMLQQHRQLVEQQQRMEEMLRDIQSDLAAIQRQLDSQSTARTFEGQESSETTGDFERGEESSRSSARPVTPERESLPPVDDRPTDNPPNPN